MLEIYKNDLIAKVNSRFILKLEFSLALKKLVYDSYLDDLIDYAFCTEEDIQTLKHYIYELEIKLYKPPYVCNACNSYTQCRKIKYIYIASEAHKKYKSILTFSRVGINISEEKLQKLDSLISPLIKQGQSIKLIYRNHKDEIPCKRSCLYNYVDAGLLSVKNIDLPRKVRYKVRNKS